MVNLNNGIIKAEIDTLGAEIRRVQVNGEDRFYDGNPKYWTGVSPILFPICGGLRDDKYTYNNQTYNLPKHGFARLMQFAVESSNSTSATFLLKENEETLKAFPWKFEFRVKYELKGASIVASFDILNTDREALYMSVGSHEAYACPEGIEDYDIIFEKKETLKAFKVEGTSISRDYDIVLKDSNTLPLYNKYFDIDALVFTDIKSRFVTLRNRKNGKETSVEFVGSDYLLLWTKPNAPYICIEPWAGIPAFVDEGYDITLKEGINRVEPDKHFKNKHTIYF